MPNGEKWPSNEAGGIDIALNPARPVIGGLPRNSITNW